MNIVDDQTEIFSVSKLNKIFNHMRSFFTIRYALFKTQACSITPYYLGLSLKDATIRIINSMSAIYA